MTTKEYIELIIKNGYTKYSEKKVGINIIGIVENEKGCFYELKKKIEKIYAQQVLSCLKKL